MRLTSAQKTTLLSWLDTPGQGQGLSDAQARDALNLLASPDYYAWRSRVTKGTLKAALDLAKFTPSDAADTTQIYENRAMLCQLKQSNALFLLSGNDSDGIDPRPLQFRLSCNDCMTAIPSGASGANQNAGWGTSGAPGAFRLLLMRKLTVFEKLFVTASANSPNAGNDTGTARGSTTNPDFLGLDADGVAVEGQISEQFVSDARRGLLP